MPYPSLMHPEPLSLRQTTVTCASTRDAQNKFCLSLCGAPGSWCAQGLFEPSEHLWQEWSLILNANSPLLPSCWGFSFALGRGLSPHSCSSTYHLTGVSPTLDVGYGFSRGHVWMWESDYKENWVPKNWCFWTVVLGRRLLRVPWTARESKQSILKEISPEYHSIISDTWKSRTTGKFGLGVQNEAGQRLTEFCQKNTLVIASTHFQQHKRRLYIWKSPDG